MRRILCTISILIASLVPITAAEDPFTSVMARRDAGLLGTPTNLFRTNLLAGTNLFLEYLSGGRLRFNVTVTPGTGTNTLFQIQGVNIGSAGTENWVNGVTGFVSGATVVLGVSINTNVFQPASSNLTNWAQIPTNILSSLTNFITAVQSNYFEVVGGQLNLTNFNLTNWANLPTNVIPALVFTNDGTNIRVVNKELNRFLILNPTNTTGAGSGIAITNKLPRISLYETNGGNQWDWHVTGLGANKYQRASDNYSLTMDTNGQITIIGVRLPTSTILLSLNTNDDPVFSFPPVFMIDQGGDIVMLNRVRMGFPTTNGLANGTLQGWASINGTNFFWTSFLFQPANTNLSNWANLPTNVIVQINPTDSFLPYRSNSTTFGDSPWFVLDVTNSATGTPIFFTNNAYIDVKGVGKSFKVINQGTEKYVLVEYNNTFVGANAGQSTTSGVENNALGWESLKDNTIGSYNTALGQAMANTTTASNNVAVGWRAMQTANGASSNVAVGVYALRGSDFTTNNIGIGTSAGRDLDVGSIFTTIIGATAANNGDSLTNTSFNTLIGARTKVGIGNTNSTALGFRAEVTNDNEFVFGNIHSSNYVFRGVRYTFPDTNGLANQALSENGSGKLFWRTIISGGSGSLAVQTNSANLGTETNFNLISGLGIQFRGTNVSGTNQLQLLVDSNLTNWVNISTNVLTGLGLTTNANQFLGAPLSIKDGASVTNLTNYSVFTVASNGIIIFGPNTTNALSATGQIMTWTNGGPSADFHIVNKNGKFAALQITEGNHAMILADVGGDVYFGPNNNGSGTILITPSTMIPVVSNTVHLGEVVRPYIDVYLSHALVLSNNNIYSLAAGANTTFTTNGSILTIASAGGAGGDLTTNENQFAGAPLSIKNGAVVTNLTNFGVFTFAVDPLGKKYQVTTANDLASLFFQGGQSSFNVHSNGMFSHAISTVDTNVGFLVYFGGDGQHIFEVQTNGLVRLTSDAGKQYDFSPSDTGLSIYHVGQPASLNLDTNGLVSIAAATVNTNVAFELYNANDGVVYFGIRTNLPGSGNYLAVDPNNLLMRTNAGSGTPGGGSGAVQFNESGAFAGTNRFVYDRTNEILTLLGTDSGTIKLSDTSTGFVVIKAGPTVMSNANWIFPTNGMNGNHVGLLAATNTSGGTNAQMKLLAIGSGLALSADGSTFSATASPGLTTNANQFLGAPLSIKDGALVTNLIDFNTLTVTSTTPAFDLANANNTFRQIVNDTVWKLFNTVPNTSGELQYGTNGLLQMLARVVNTNTAFQIVDDYSTNTLLAVTTNGLLWLRGAITLTNRPGDGTPWIRLNETNGRAYTEFTVTNSLATNRLVWWLGSNTVAASQVLKVHSTAISDGINTIVLTNDTDTAGTGTNSVVQTNGTTVGSIGTLNFVPGQNTTVTGMVNGSVVTLAVNATGGSGTNTLWQTNDVTITTAGTADFVYGVTGYVDGAVVKLGINSAIFSSTTNWTFDGNNIFTTHYTNQANTRVSIGTNAPFSEAKLHIENGYDGGGGANPFFIATKEGYEVTRIATNGSIRFTTPTVGFSEIGVSPDIKTNNMLYLPTNAMTGPLVSENVNDGTNQLMVVNLSPGQYLTKNSSSGLMVASNVPGAAGLSFTNQLWVDKTGNDTTGTRNRFDKPFQTISNAIAAAVAGDVVNVGVGYFTNMTLQLKTNMTLRGVGDLTVIVGTNLYTAGSLIVPKDNCIIENLRLEAATNYTFVNMIGISSTLTDSGEVGFTNLLVQNVSYNCEEDFYHIVHTNLTHAIFDNLRGKSKWDQFAVGSAGVTTNNHFFSVRNSTLITGPEMSVENTGAQRAVWLNGGARGEFVNCEIVVTNGDGTSPAHAIELYTNGLPEVSKLDLINTRIRSAGIAGSFAVSSTNGTVTITGRLIPTNTIFGAFTQTPGIVENLTAGANITLTPNSSSGYTIAAAAASSSLTVASNGTIQATGVTNLNLVGNTLITNASGDVSIGFPSGSGSETNWTQGTTNLYVTFFSNANHRVAIGTNQFDTITRESRPDGAFENHLGNNGDKTYLAVRIDPTNSYFLDGVDLWLSKFGTPNYKIQVSIWVDDTSGTLPFYPITPEYTIYTTNIAGATATNYLAGSFGVFLTAGQKYWVVCRADGQTTSNPSQAAYWKSSSITTGVSASGTTSPSTSGTIDFTYRLNAFPLPELAIDSSVFPTNPFVTLTRSNVQFGITKTDGDRIGGEGAYTMGVSASGSAVKMVAIPDDSMLTLSWRQTNVTWLRPQAPSGTTPFVFGTGIGRTDGLLLEVNDASSNLFSISYFGNVFAKGGMATNVAAFPTIITNLALNTYYTNFNQRATVRAFVWLASSTTNSAEVGLYTGDIGTATWSETNFIVTAGAGVVSSNRYMISADIQPNARFILTNLSVAPATAALTVGASQWTRW